MGRTIHYCIPKTTPVSARDYREIDRVQQEYNKRFTWTCENLWLEWPEGYLGRRYSASGFTKVRENEWNAFLVLRFLTWVSRKYSQLQIEVVDEGQYILAGSIVLKAGSPRIVQRDNPNDPERLQEATALARKGVFYATVDASEYLDCPELRQLGLPRKKKARMSLDELARHIDFPGESGPPARAKARRSGGAARQGG